MKFARQALIAMTMLGAFLVPMTPAHAYSCAGNGSSKVWNAASGVLTARGVTSWILTPKMSDIGSPSGVDGYSFGGVELYYGSDRISFGWIWEPGRAKLRLHTSEYKPGSGEHATYGDYIDSDEFHKFSIVRTTSNGSTGYFEFRLDGEVVGTSHFSHTLSMRPASIGWISDICFRMHHFALSPTGDSTLYYVNTGGTSWIQFNDAFLSGGPHGSLMVNTTSGGVDATHAAIGGGP